MCADMAKLTISHADLASTARIIVRDGSVSFTQIEFDFAREVLRIRDCVRRARCEIMDATHNMDYIISLLDQALGGTGGYGEQGDE